MATKWKLLPVPEIDFSEIKSIVEKRQIGRGEPIAPNDDEVVSDQAAIEAVREAAFAKHIPWPTEALTRLANGTSLTAQRWAVVMDLLAKNPGVGNELSTSAVVAGTSLTVNEWRDACRKMRPYLEKNYPDAPVWGPGKYEGDPMWPVVAIAGKNLKVYDELYVGITEEQAKRWLAAR